MVLSVLDPSKRMQKLLGRIRQQQDAWSKQNVNRKMDNLSEKDQVRRGKKLSGILFILYLLAFYVLLNFFGNTVSSFYLILFFIFY